MTDETTTNETTVDNTGGTGTPEPVSVQEYQAEVQRLKAELTNVREEAASRRVELREVKEQLSAAKTMDEYNEVVAKYEAAEKARAHDALVNTYAGSFPAELRESVNWPESEDDIKSLAQKLSQFSVSYGESNTPGGGLNPQGSFDNEEYDPAAIAARIPR